MQPDRNSENRGGRNASRGRGRVRGGPVRCYTCGQLGHMSWDCPENFSRQRRGQVVQDEPKDPKKLEVYENYHEQDEALLMRKVIDESDQRKSLLRQFVRLKVSVVN